MSKSAVLIEDRDDQAVAVTGVLVNAGFSVAAYVTAEEAEREIPGLPRPIDLIVIDRRLPYFETDEPVDEVGDCLLENLVNLLPDTLFVVFTGHADVRQVQQSIKGRGTIPMGSGIPEFDRVSHFEKDQSLEFAEYIGQVSERLDCISDVDLRVVGDAHVPEISRRLLKKVALEFAGTSITAVKLVGGLTSAAVWSCQIIDSDGLEMARVVVKTSAIKEVVPRGGLHSVLEAPWVASTLAILRGMCDNHQASVMQAGSVHPVSLFETWEADLDSARVSLGELTRVLDTASSGGERAVPLQDLIVDILPYAKLTEILTAVGVMSPRASLAVTTSFAAQHGDLHAGNVLISDGKPVLIDLDSETLGSQLIDPLTLLMSSFFHPSSPWLESVWPTVNDCAGLGGDVFFVGCPDPMWFESIWKWVERRMTSERELWALVLAYAARQLQYEDIKAHRLAYPRARALVTRAAAALQDS